MIYLDNSATTQPFEVVASVVAQSMQQDFYNPSALYKPALETTLKIRAARQAVATLLQAPAQHIIFTSGATESNNLALTGTINTVRSGNLVTTQIEHHSVLEVFRYFARRGADVRYICPNADGTITTDCLAGCVDENTKLVSIQHVNNETGAVQDLRVLADAVKRIAPGAIFHVDGVQGYGRIKADITKVDYYSASAHKINGPKGIGFLYAKTLNRLQGVQLGGGQEKNNRSGTENTPAILGFGCAAQEYTAHMEQYVSQMMEQKLLYYNAFAQMGAVVNGPQPQLGAPHILNVSFPGVPGEILVHVLESMGVLIGVGSACSSHAGKISPVLQSMKVPAAQAKSAVRISLSPLNTSAEALVAIEKFKEALHSLQRIR